MLCSVFQLASMDTTVLVVDNDVFVTTMCLVMLKQADASVPLEEPENVVNFVRIYTGWSKKASRLILSCHAPLALLHDIITTSL